MESRHHRLRNLTGLFQLLIISGLLVFPVPQAGAAVIDTFAGGLSGSLPALSTSIDTPLGTTVDAEGNIYVVDSSHQLIRKVDPSGNMTVVAGNGMHGFSGDGGPATEARLSSPRGVSVDGEGNLYIADTFNNRVRKVDVNGIITTVAGTGSNFYYPNGGLATSTPVSQPWDVIVDESGNLYIASFAHSRVSKVDTNGYISTVAGDGTPPDGLGDGGPATDAILRNPGDLAFDNSGNLYIADYYNYRIRKVDTGGIITTVAGNGIGVSSGDGGPAVAASVHKPMGVDVDLNGNIFIAEVGSSKIRMVDGSGIITTVAGDGAAGFEGDGGLASQARINNPWDVAVDAAGNLYIADTFNERIRKVNGSGIISTAAGNGFRNYSGDGGPATSAALFPLDVALSGDGSVYIADRDNHRIRKIDPVGIITTVAGNGTIGFCGDNGSATEACLYYPTAVAVDNSGSLYIADFSNQRIRKVDSGGIITTVAGNGSVGFNGDGGPATGTSITDPTGVTVDAAGNIYIADYGNHRVRKVDTSGIITTVAGSDTAGFCGDDGPAVNACLQNPRDVKLDSDGNLYIAGYINQRIRMVDTSGIITTVAGSGTAGFCGDGGPAVSACLNAPYRIAVDGNSLYIAEPNNSRVRIVDGSGYIDTFAGGGSPDDGIGDGGAPLGANLPYPAGLAIDAGGNIYVADWTQRRVRWVNTGNPVANAGGPYLSGPGFTVTLDGTGSHHPESPTRSIVSYAWDLDDDGTFETSGVTVNRSWPSAGDYPVALRVEDDLGAFSIQGAVVRVFADPVAVIDSITPQTSFINESVTFQGSTEVNITGWSWSSDLDGALSDRAVFTTSSLSVGTHTISYQITDNLGRTSAPVTEQAVVRPESERTDLALEWGDITFWQNGQEVTNPAAGSAVTVRAAVHNLSDSDSAPVTVNFTDTYENIDILEETSLGTANIPAIVARGTGVAEIAWTTPVGMDGYHVVQVDVDPDASETFVTNNVATRFVVVGDHQAAGNISINLSVQTVSTVYQGSRFTVSGLAQYEWANGSTLPLMGGELTVKVMGGQEWQTQTGDFGSFSQEIYAPMTPDLYTLRVEVTDATLTEFSESQLNVIPLPGPDLTVYNVWLSERVETLPETVYAYVVNKGGFDITSDFVNRVEVRSPSGQLEYTGDVTVVGGLTAGQGTTITFAGWTPAVSGTYEVTVTADWTDVVAEEYETNNSKTVNAYVYPHHVDLEVLELKQECDTVSAKVRNRGGLAAGSFTVDFSDGGGVYGTGSVGSLSGKDAWTWVSSDTNYAPDGVHTITATVVSGADAVASNNAGSAQFDFTDVSDFTVTDLWVNGKRWMGSNIVYLALGDTLEAEVRNIGCLSDSGTLSFRVDGQAVGAAAPVSLAGLGVQTVSVPFTFTNPPYPAATDYELAAEVDVTADAVQGNDLRTESLWVYPALPDYEVLSEDIDFSFDPARHPSRNEKFSITAQVCNVGDQPGTAFQVAFYEEGQEQIGVVQTISQALNPSECYTAGPVDDLGAEVQWGTGFSGNHVILVSAAPVVGGQDDPNDDNNQATRKVWINTPPVAVADIVNLQSGYLPGEEVVFTGASSHDDLDLDGLGQVVSYDWDYGDGFIASTASVEAPHGYTAPGTYTAWLTVVDSNGAPSDDASGYGVLVSCTGYADKDPCNTNPACEWVGKGKSGSCQDLSCTPDEPGLELTCNDGTDNDCDFLTDSLDPDCCTETVETTCGDGVDNDCDGLVDTADPDCPCVPDEPGLELTCSDGSDNDCDGFIDSLDTDCPSGGVCGDYTQKDLCNADPDCEWSGSPKSGICQDAAGCTITEDPEVSCSDGSDNDCDGLTDTADPDCPTGGVCDNDGICDPGEDCTGCPSDCDGVTGGKPANRYCCGNGVQETPEGDGSICDGNY